MIVKVPLEICFKKHKKEDNKPARTMPIKWRGYLRVNNAKGIKQMQENWAFKMKIMMFLLSWYHTALYSIKDKRPKRPRKSRLTCMYYLWLMISTKMQEKLKYVWWVSSSVSM